MVGLLAADPDAATLLLADLARASDAELRDAARRLAARVFVRLAAARQPVVRGVRRLGAGRFDGDLDLELTIDRNAGAWPPPQEQLVTRAWRAHRQSVCLLIDASGSMSGLALATAAVAASAVVLAADQRVDTAVAAFGAATTVLQPLGSRRVPEELTGELLGLRGHGLTDIATAFRAAAAQLASGPGAGRRVVLLSDCQPTAGGDPAEALAGIDRLDVLCPLPAGSSTEPDVLDAAKRLARLGGGISYPVRALADVPVALANVLTAV
jgi:magnesium chelatase subunit D